MRFWWIVFILLFFSMNQVFSQHGSCAIVSKARYFDISMPLIGMKTVPSEAVDKSWKNGAVKNYFKDTRLKNQGPRIWPDSVSQIGFGPDQGDTIFQNFSGIGNLNRVVPPDTYGDVGPDHYFQMVNTSYAIFDKSGAKLFGPFNSNTIWNGLPNNSNNGDGVVLYDDQANRWFISQFSLPNFPDGPFYQMIAVSQTPDPMGSYYRWEFEFDELPDYPKFGIWPDGFYMSYNRLRASVLSYKGTGAAVFDRTAMLNGDPQARIILFQLPSGTQIFSPIPSDCDGSFPLAGTPNYFTYIQYYYLGIMEFHADWDNPANSTFGDNFQVPVSPFINYTEGIPQLGTFRKLTPIDDRLMYRLQFRNFGEYQAMVVNHTVNTEHSTGIRWYELRRTTGNWSLYQQSTFAPDSNYRWMGSIAMDLSGNIALGYSVSGDSLFPSIRYTGRMNNDPRNQMTIAERSIIEGQGAQTGEWSGLGRWGDYSSMVADPVKPGAFWYTQEYFDSTSVMNWKTRIASFSFANILSIHAFTGTPIVCQGSAVQLDVDAKGGSGNYTYSWIAVPPGFTSTIKNPIVALDSTTKFIVKVSDGEMIKVDTLVIEIYKPPTVYAGGDTIWCRDIKQIPLYGEASNDLYVKWITMGDGLFGNRYKAITNYIPGHKDKTIGYVDLSLTAYPYSSCLPVSDMTRVLFDSCSGNDGPDEALVHLDLFPNPTQGSFIIQVSGNDGGNIEVEIYNTTGQLIRRESAVTGEEEAIMVVHIADLSEGVYLIRISVKGETIIKKMYKI